MAHAPLTGKDIIRQPLLDLLVSDDYRTRSKSTHKLWFLSTLAIWDIEKEARHFSASIKWTADILGYDLPKQERIFCGDEHSVVGRYNQNLCHDLTPILQEYIQSGLHFADYKCAINQKNFKKVPDFVLLDKEHKPILVGEAKTPWLHDIETAQAENVTFRNYLGQIANYMRATKCRFGWLTTYNQSMFFKQEPHPTKKHKWVLCHSPVMKHDTEWQEVLGTEEELDDPTKYRQKVTLRECFVYLAKQASKSSSIDNKMKPEDWVGQKSSRIVDDDSVSFESSSAESTDSDESDGDENDVEEDENTNEERFDKDIDQNEASKPGMLSHRQKVPERQIQTRSLTYREPNESSVASIESGTRHLAIEDQPEPYANFPWKRGTISVHFDKSRGKWSYNTSSGSRVHVDLKYDEDEGFFFVLNNHCWRAKKIE